MSANITTVTKRQPPPPPATENAVARVLGTDLVADLARVATRKFSADYLLELTLHAATKVPLILRATPESLFLALTTLARWELTLGDEAHLLPFKDRSGKIEVVAIPSYQGLKALLYRNHLARMIVEYPIYEGDEFEHELGPVTTLRHRPCVPSKRGALAGAWIQITPRVGQPFVHYMHIEDIEVIRDKSKSWSRAKVGPCPPWYAMKTVVRNWASKQPKGGAGSSVVMHQVFEQDEVADAEVEILGTDTPAAVPAAPAEAPTPPKLATLNQRAVVRSMMQASVITADEREQIEGYLQDEAVTFAELGEKIDDLQGLITRRERRAATADVFPAADPEVPPHE